MLKKYVKPKSLTWWAAVAWLIGGLIVATEPLHGLADLTVAINNMTGGMSATTMINIGLGGVGLRGALG